MLKILRSYVTEALSEAQVKISDAYKKKEAVRAELQGLVAAKVKSGAIQDQEALDAYIASMGLALTALKMVPFDVWKRM